MDKILMTKEEVLRRNKKAVLLIALFLVTLLIFVATTYAWFVGFTDSSVNDFTINITTKDSLEISLDGYTWGEDLTITENTIKSHTNGGDAYENNTNHWVGDDGLVPVSTSGDNTNGKLDLFMKSSLTTSLGGFKMTADKLDNSSEELPYYVAFDIFIKNRSGDTYNPSYNLLDDESVFLLNNSTVLGTASGDTAYGIQNSARVAFVQLGRINMDDLVAYTTPIISCDTPTAEESFTPLCNKLNNIYKTVIWEPNELDHATELLNYYATVCRKRTATNTYNTDTCTDITSTYVPAYTIKRNITTSHYIDIYDGLNSYNDSIQTQASVAVQGLQDTKTFTDTMKETEGQYSVFKLASHSVTKIRVYVYLEGQDVDNYDLVTNDVDISVTFGFTKEKRNADVLLDVENPTLDFAVREVTADGSLAIPIQSVSLDGSDETITWEEWVTDTQTSTDATKTCNNYICIENTGNNVFVKEADSSLSPYIRYSGVLVEKTDNIANARVYLITPPAS